MVNPSAELFERKCMKTAGPAIRVRCNSLLRDFVRNFDRMCFYIPSENSASKLRGEGFEGAFRGRTAIPRCLGLCFGEECCSSRFRDGNEKSSD